MRTGWEHVCQRRLCHGLPFQEHDLPAPQAQAPLPARLPPQCHSGSGAPLQTSGVPSRSRAQSPRGRRPRGNAAVFAESTYKCGLGATGCFEMSLHL